MNQEHIVSLWKPITHFHFWQFSMRIQTSDKKIEKSNKPILQIKQIHLHLPFLICIFPFSSYTYVQCTIVNSWVLDLHHNPKTYMCSFCDSVKFLLFQHLYKMYRYCLDQNVNLQNKYIAINRIYTSGQKIPDMFSTDSSQFTSLPLFLLLSYYITLIYSTHRN